MGNFGRSKKYSVENNFESSQKRKVENIAAQVYCSLEYFKKGEKIFSFIKDVNNILDEKLSYDAILRCAEKYNLKDIINAIDFDDNRYTVQESFQSFLNEINKNEINNVFNHAFEETKSSKIAKLIKLYFDKISSIIDLIDKSYKSKSKDFMEYILLNFADECCNKENVIFSKQDLICILNCLSYRNKQPYIFSCIPCLKENTIVNMPDNEYDIASLISKSLNTNGIKFSAKVCSGLSVQYALASFLALSTINIISKKEYNSVINTQMVNKIFGFKDIKKLKKFIENYNFINNVDDVVFEGMIQNVKLFYNKTFKNCASFYLINSLSIYDFKKRLKEAKKEPLNTAFVEAEGDESISSNSDREDSESKSISENLLILSNIITPRKKSSSSSKKNESPSSSSEKSLKEVKQAFRSHSSSKESSSSSRNNSEKSVNKSHDQRKDCQDWMGPIEFCFNREFCEENFTPLANDLLIEDIHDVESAENKSILKEREPQCALPNINRFNNFYDLKHDIHELDNLILDNESKHCKKPRKKINILKKKEVDFLQSHINIDQSSNQVIQLKSFKLLPGLKKAKIRQVFYQSEDIKNKDTSLDNIDSIAVYIQGDSNPKNRKLKIFPKRKSSSSKLSLAELEAAKKLNSGNCNRVCANQGNIEKVSKIFKKRKLPSSEEKSLSYSNTVSQLNYNGEPVNKISFSDSCIVDKVKSNREPVNKIRFSYSCIVDKVKSNREPSKDIVSDLSN